MVVQLVFSRVTQELLDEKQKKLGRSFIVGLRFFVAEVLLSESLLVELLDSFAFFVTAGADLVTCLLLPSSDESDDEDSFFCLLVTADDGGTTVFFAAGATVGAKKVESNKYSQCHFECGLLEIYLSLLAWFVFSHSHPKNRNRWRTEPWPDFYSVELLLV